MEDLYQAFFSYYSLITGNQFGSIVICASEDDANTWFNHTIGNDHEIADSKIVKLDESAKEEVAEYLASGKVGKDFFTRKALRIING